ncbi:MAG: dTDP-4-dehydrorhamnose 3,5-epimerase [Desulfobacteraceae bacterium]|nr:dTDP-4-dehydrorhamnose 3,5-epimerase [Desulfobacteraceae bacterium]
MNIVPTKINDCFEISPNVQKDDRGVFVKNFHQDIFIRHGLKTKFAEEYYSYSKKGVLRGFHFQIPPYDHVKMVYCVSGTIMDAIVDLRKGSPTYGHSLVFELKGEVPKALYLEKGIAHAFYVMSEFAIVMYKVTSVYSPEHDAGILWNSTNVSWPANNPILSERDKCFPPIDKFDSPFFT